MHQLIGLILLVLAVSAAFYASTHYTDLLKLKLPFPLRPITVPSYQTIEISPAAPVTEPIKPVRISWVQTANNLNSYQQIVFYDNTAVGTVTDVTGWTVKSNQGSFQIPKAQEVYSFGGYSDDIRLRGGNQLAIYSLEGSKGNFRLNKCLGYLEDVSPFVPSVPKSCPAVSRSEINNLSGACQDYLLSLRSCQNPAANPPVPVDDDNCHQFLSKLNYVGCVDKYKIDTDFLQNEWRVWLGNAANIFDSVHDKVQLLDRTGKIVDEYVY